jgi:hypothetical protein
MASSERPEAAFDGDPLGAAAGLADASLATLRLTNGDYHAVFVTQRYQTAIVTWR